MQAKGHIAESKFVEMEMPHLIISIKEYLEDHEWDEDMLVETEYKIHAFPHSPGSVFFEKFTKNMFKDTGEYSRMGRRYNSGVDRPKKVIGCGDEAFFEIVRQIGDLAADNEGTITPEAFEPFAEQFKALRNDLIHKVEFVFYGSKDLTDVQPCLLLATQLYQSIPSKAPGFNRFDEVKELWAELKAATAAKQREKDEEDSDEEDSDEETTTARKKQRIA